MDRAKIEKFLKIAVRKVPNIENSDHKRENRYKKFRTPEIEI